MSSAALTYSLWCILCSSCCSLHDNTSSCKMHWRVVPVLRFLNHLNKRLIVNPDFTDDRSEEDSFSVNVGNAALTVISPSPLLPHQPMRPLKATATTSQPVLTIQQVDTIFYKIQDIFEIHKEFYDALLPSIQQWDEKVTVGHLFQKLVSLRATLKGQPGGGGCVSHRSPSSTAKVSRPSLWNTVLNEAACCLSVCTAVAAACSQSVSFWADCVAWTCHFRSLPQASACVLGIAYLLTVMSCTARECATSKVHINITAQTACEH